MPTASLIQKPEGRNVGHKSSSSNEPAAGGKRPSSPAHVPNRTSPATSTSPSTSDAQNTTDITSSATGEAASAIERGEDELTPSRLPPFQYKRRKVRENEADNGGPEDDTSGTLASTGSERTATTYVSSDRPETVESAGTTTTQADSQYLAHPAADAAPEEEESAKGIAQNDNEPSYSDALKQMQKEVAERREQLAAALLDRQQRQQRRDIGTHAREGQLRLRQPGAALSSSPTGGRIVDAEAAATAAAALANSLRPSSLGIVGGPSSLKGSNLIHSDTTNQMANNPYQQALLASQYGTGTYPQPSLLAGLNLTSASASAAAATTTTANSALLRNLTEVEILQHLQDQNRRLQLSLASASGLSLNDAALFARFQSGGLSGLPLSSSPSALALPSASIASSLVSAADAASLHGILVGQGGAPFPARGQGSIRSTAPPLPNISPAATKAPVSQRITRSDGLVCLSSGIPHYTERLILPMSVPNDPAWLSTYLCFVRSDCVEVFEATDRDVTMRLNSKLIYPRQVGIRCRFCSHIHHRDRAGRSTSFPSSLSRIYQSLTMMLREHFPAVS